MKLKSISILLFIVIFSSLVLAQNTNEVKLTDVSDNAISYYCFGCNPQVDGREGSLVWYKCNQDTWNCQISVRRTSDDHELTIVKFNKARAYFESKKLMYITVDPSSTHPNAVPFNIAGIEIPYVSAGDRINFGRANTVNGGPALRPINEAYFQTFYYEVGSARTPIIDDTKVTPLGKTIKYHETLPLHLCGQEFFDVTSELIRGRNRNSWFLVKKQGSDCIVSSYRISTETDDLWLRNNQNLAARTYPCGKNHVYFATKHSSGELANSESDSKLTNFECKIDGEVARLNCPESNVDEKRLCEDETKNILFQAGSTQYFVTGGKITVLPADMTTSIQTTSILLNEVQNIKVFNGRNVVDIIPEGNAEILFVGHLDDSNPSVASRLLVKSGKVTTEVNGQLVDYILNRPRDTPDAFRYSIVFQNNALKSIAEAEKEWSYEQRVFEGITITRLRVAENLRTFGQSVSASNKVFNLFPLSEGENNVQVSNSYVMYTVPRERMTLRDVARAQPGMSQLDGAQLQNFMEQIRETSRLHYDEAEGGAINSEFRGPANWASPGQIGVNTAFGAGDIVLIPTGRTFLGASGNRVTTTATPERARQNVQDRAQRRVSRPMDDSSCTRLSGECQNNAVAGESCSILRENKAGYYNRGSCLSNPSSSYLCCVPESSVGATGQTRRIQNNVPQGERIVRGGSGFCRPAGGICVSTDPNVLREDYNNNLNEFCFTQATPAGQDPYRNWAEANLDCGISDNSVARLCCGPAAPEQARETNAPASGIQSARVTKVEVKNGANWITLTGLTANNDLADVIQESQQGNTNLDAPISFSERLILKRSPRSLLCHVSYTIEGSPEQRALLTNDNEISKTYNINDRRNQQEMNRAYNLYRRELTGICSNVATDIVAEHLLSLSPGSGITGRNYQLSIVRP